MPSKPERFSLRSGRAKKKKSSRPSHPILYFTRKLADLLSYPFVYIQKTPAQCATKVFAQGNAKVPNLSYNGHHEKIMLPAIAYAKGSELLRL